MQTNLLLQHVARDLFTMETAQQRAPEQDCVKKFPHLLLFYARPFPMSVLLHERVQMETRLKQKVF